MAPPNAPASEELEMMTAIRKVRSSGLYQNVNVVIRPGKSPIGVQYYVSILSVGYYLQELLTGL